MGEIKSFRDLKVWQKTHLLVLKVYHLTKKYPKEEQFGLISQTRRAVISVASNIVEGFKKRSKKDSCNFYNISEGSLEETKYQLLVAKDLVYIEPEEYDEMMNICEEVGRMLNGWIVSQSK